MGRCFGSACSVVECRILCEQQTACPTGSFTDAPSADSCVLCVAGTFQDAAQQTACKVCTPGYYCAEGAAAALPCPGGTHKNASLAVMTSVDECVVCPPGTFCPVGSADAKPCAPGTYNDGAGNETCGMRRVGFNIALASVVAHVPRRSHPSHVPRWSHPTRAQPTVRRACIRTSPNPPLASGVVRATTAARGLPRHSLVPAARARTNLSP